MPVYALDGVKPQLPPEGRYWIAPNATLIGDVVLHEDVGIWFGAVLRGDNERHLRRRALEYPGRRRRCTPIAGFPLHIGADCTIGHNAILHGCHIGDGALIGMGAIVLNGARIGRMPHRRRRAGDGEQELPRRLADRRLARQGRARAG